MRGAGRFALCAVLATVGSGCADPAPTAIEGRPTGGPYRMTLTVDPTPPLPGVPTTLTSRIETARDRRPIEDLQVVHERIVHNFIVGLDFKSFAHIHHEDFRAPTPADLEHATFSFPYTFPRAGHYRMVSEFTHRNRGWLKQFDIAVGEPAPQLPVVVDLARERAFGAYRARLDVSPATPVAGFETELVLDLTRDGQPVTDLELLLGSEVHVALWRIDGTHFGHAHSYTPHMAAMLESMHDRAVDAATRAARMAEMMVAMIDMPAELVFPGPRVPIRIVFHAPGTYAIFLQAAPGGKPQVFDFMLEVVSHAEGMDTRVESMVEPAADHSGH